MPRGAAGRARGSCRRREPKPGACLTRPPDPTRGSRPAHRSRANPGATSSCDLPRLHPTSPDAAPGRRAARGASPLCPGRPRSQTSALCATAASLETPRERRGPRALGRRTTGHTTRHHPAGVVSARHLPQGGGASPPQESCPFSRKAPSPTFPPIHSPASRRSASRASRGRTGHVHARARCRARLVPLGSRRPQPARAHTRGGATSGGAQFPRLPPPGAEL